MAQKTHIARGKFDCSLLKKFHKTRTVQQEQKMRGNERVTFLAHKSPPLIFASLLLPEKEKEKPPNPKQAKNKGTKPEMFFQVM